MQNKYFTKRWREFVNADGDWDDECIEGVVLADTLEEAETIISKLATNLNLEPAYIYKFFDAELGIYKVRDPETNEWFEQKKKGEK